LAEACTLAKTAGDQSSGELCRLRDELTTLRATLKDRDAELAQMRLAGEHVQKSWAQQTQDSLRKAEQAWQAEEAARFAAAEAQWQDKSATMLKEARAHAETARHQASGELRRLHDELAAVQATLKDREAALAQARSDAEHARKCGAQEAQDSLRKAEQAWKAGESTRFASAEARWRKQSGSALAEATARYEAAETALAQLRTQATRQPSVDANIGGSAAFDELVALRMKRADRETELAQLHLATEENAKRTMQGSKIVIRRNQMIDSVETLGKERRTPKRPGPIRDALVAASLAVFAITAYPSVVPLLPERWRSNIGAIAGGIGPMIDHTSAPLGSPPPTSPNIAAQQMAVVARDVNLRANPSTAAEVITTLPRGRKIATIEQRGNWTLVQIDGKNDERQPLRGWAYSSFLNVESGGDAKPPKAAPQTGYPH
jgi:hypothetical protein